MIRYFYTIIFLGTFLFGHPHTFIDVFLKINSTQNIINNINFKWKFDEMTSQLLIMDFDQNGNKKIDKNEQIFIEKNYFNFLNDYNYYTNIKIAGKNIKTKPINFNCYIEKNRIIYKFDIIFKKNKNDIKIDFYDEEMFTAFILKNKFIKSKIKFNILDLDNDFYFAYRLEFN